MRARSEFTFACAAGAFIALAAPAPGGGGANEPRAACSWLSESIRKFAEVTICSPALRPFSHDEIVAYSAAQLNLAWFKITAAMINKGNLPDVRTEALPRPE